MAGRGLKTALTWTSGLLQDHLHVRRIASAGARYATSLMKRAGRSHITFTSRQTSLPLLYLPMARLIPVAYFWRLLPSQNMRKIAELREASVPVKKICRPSFDHSASWANMSKGLRMTRRFDEIS